jgi:hypothetical protein
MPTTNLAAARRHLDALLAGFREIERRREDGDQSPILCLCHDVVVDLNLDTDSRRLTQYYFDRKEATQPCPLCGRQVVTNTVGCSETCDDILDADAKKKRRARSNRRAVADAYDSLGMKKVRGALGGTYYE